MTALFADPFCWIALADSNDSAHRMALTLTAERPTARIVATDEVLTEYLNFFCGLTEASKGAKEIDNIIDSAGGWPLAGSTEQHMAQESVGESDRLMNSRPEGNRRPTDASA